MSSLMSLPQSFGGKRNNATFVSPPKSELTLGTYPGKKNSVLPPEVGVNRHYSSPKCITSEKLEGLLSLIGFYVSSMKIAKQLKLFYCSISWAFKVVFSWFCNSLGLVL